MYIGYRGRKELFGKKGSSTEQVIAKVITPEERELDYALLEGISHELRTFCFSYYLGKQLYLAIYYKLQDFTVQSATLFWSTFARLYKAIVDQTVL